jgi:NitT/TauT family transport system substrate-binding protein
MVEQGGGHILVDERDLWPDGRFVTTHLIVSTAYLERNPDLVRRLLEGHVEATTFVNEEPDEARAVVAAAISELTGTNLEAGLVERAWANLTFTNDPIAASLTESARRAESQGLLEPVDLAGIHDLELLNEVLVAAGEAEIAP